MKAERVFIIVLDSFGVGECPDSAAFGDSGSNTLRSVASSRFFHAPHLQSLGLFNLDGVDCGEKVASPLAAHGRIGELSAGKDTTTGHWEIGGIVSKTPMPTFPDGFPSEIIDEFTRATGRKILCNKPYSGTAVIRDFGQEHLDSGKLIVYTSADSVFQIAAHERIIPRELLYEYCRQARKILCGSAAVGRVIARPFDGEYPDFFRTDGRHDFSLTPPSPTLLNAVSNAGLPVISIGKISDIFAGSGVSESHPTKSNADGMQMISEMAATAHRGLIFANLVDFDMLFGHRNDVDGYATAISEFDRWLGVFLPKLNGNDVLFITADHGCDPLTPSTDHSREFIPLLVYGKRIKPLSLGTRFGFCDIGKTAAELLGVESSFEGKSFAGEVLFD